ncbi:MAG: hypothetical protein LBN18_00900 [Dysgonamonadaceae bacterium]|jgi:hypothetical protein|nr:hypothetical protein [Dysgonamonadaceae bacterium]
MMEAVLEGIYLNIPRTDLKFFKELAGKMGWITETKDGYLKKYIASRPKHVPLSDEEIMSEVAAVRYRK